MSPEYFQSSEYVAATWPFSPSLVNSIVELVVPDLNIPLPVSVYSNFLPAKFVFVCMLETAVSPVGFQQLPSKTNVRVLVAVSVANQNVYETSCVAVEV